MFQKTELARLQARKELLVLQSSANRLVLAAEWRQIRSPDRWREEAGRLLWRHPMLAAALAAAGGILVTRAMRKPAAVSGRGGRLGRMASLALTVWKLMRSRKSRA